MAYRDKEKYRLAQRNWYYKNKDKVRATRKNIRERKSEFVRALKAIPCSDCKNAYPYFVMEFDHYSGTKQKNISDMINYRSSWVELKNEVRKCEVVCVNCHRIRTFERKTNHG